MRRYRLKRHLRGTWHILTQVKWFYKLKKKYNCSKVEMEYQIFNKNHISKIHHSRKYYLIDVYGETKNGEIYIVEIGNVGFDKKQYLRQLMSDSNVRVIFVHSS